MTARHQLGDEQRAEARRLYERHGWTMEKIAEHLGVSKGAIAGMSHRQRWLRWGMSERRTVVRRPRSPQMQKSEIPACPRGAPVGLSQASPGNAPAAKPATLPVPSEATHTTTPRPADRSTADGVVAVVVPAGEAVAGASPATVDGDGLVRRRMYRLLHGGGRSRAEIGLDTILGHARRLAAPPVLSAPLAAVPPVRHRTCQWPIGEPGTDSFRYCGAPRCAGSRLPYCADHRRLAVARPDALEASS